MTTKTGHGWRTIELVLLAGILFFLALALFGQYDCPDTTDEPLVILLEARDAETGEVLYHRKAYVFFGGIIENAPARMVAVDNVQISRVMRPQGSRCNPVLQNVIERGNVRIDWCYPEKEPK